MCLHACLRICERRLCESVDVETVATTLTLAEQNHADELKKVCLDFVSKNLAAVIATDGYRHMTLSCPQLQVRQRSEGRGGTMTGSLREGGALRARQGGREIAWPFCCLTLCLPLPHSC